MPEKCTEDLSDDISLKKLQLIDELLKSRSLLSEYMRNGYYQLSTSRKSLGQHSVSALRIPETDFSATCRVGTETKTDEICDVEFRESETVSVPTSKGCSPLSWFSALPPTSLRMAQSQFTSTVSLAVRCASLQRHISALDSKYCQLNEDTGEIKCSN